MSFDQDSFREMALKYFVLWRCVPEGEPFFTHSSLLWPASRSLEKVMLKIPNPADDEVHGAEILKIFDGRGTVRLLENDQHVQLLERIGSAEKPALHQMVAEGNDDQATRILCEVIRDLHEVSKQKRIPPFAYPFRQRSQDMLRNLAEGGLGAKHASSFKIAYEVSHELLAETAETEILLHGDIHHFNILFSQKRGWLAIDPKGIAGPRTYEYASSLVNPYMHESVADPDRMIRQASIMADLGQLDRTTLLRFTFVHAMQCAAWSNSVADQKYWLACARTAARLANISASSLDS